MPLVRYFFFVGGVLLALLFVADAAFPTLPVADSTDNTVDLPVIRIHSDRKWPQRVVFDTRVPPAVPASTQASAAVPVKDATDEAKARARDAFAQLQPPAPRQVEPSVPGKVSGKPERKPHPKRRIAKVARTPAPPMIQLAQQPRFGFFANDGW
jgi:hypothetical protein